MGFWFLLATVFVPSWFPSSCWFRLGFRCLSPFFSLLSFRRNEVMFHRDFLIPPGFGSGSGAYLLLLSSFGSPEKEFCSIMMSWFLLVPVRVPVLVSLLLSSFFSPENGYVPSWLVVPSGSGSGSGASLPSSLFVLFSGKGLCSIHHDDFLVPPGSFSGSGACLPSCEEKCHTLCTFLLGPGPHKIHTCCVSKLPCDFTGNVQLILWVRFARVILVQWPWYIHLRHECCYQFFGLLLESASFSCMAHTHFLRDSPHLHELLYSVHIVSCKVLEISHPSFAISLNCPAYAS